MAAHTAAEIVELLAFHDLEPIGEERADLRAALLGVRLAQVQGSKATLKAFLLNFDPPDKKPDIGKQLEAMAIAAEAAQSMNDGGCSKPGSEADGQLGGPGRGTKARDGQAGSVPKERAIRL